MTATKIINVVKDDSFEEIFDLFKNTAAEEVIFILPKKNKVFNSEDQFQQIKAEADQQGKKISLMSANADINSMAQQYDFEILQNKSSSPRAPKKKIPINHPEPVVPVFARADDTDTDVIPDDSGVIDPHTTSDETMGILDDEGEKIEGKDIDQEEALEHDEVGAAADVADEDAFSAEDTDTKENAGLEEKEDEELIKEEPIQDTSDLTSENETEEPVATFTGTGRLDGMVNVANDGRNVRVQKNDDKLVKLGIRRSNLKKDKIEDIAKVWQQEQFTEGETMWTGIRKPDERPSLWSRIFPPKSAFNIQKTQVPIVRPRRPHRILATFVALALIAGSGAVYMFAGNAQVVIMPFSKKIDLEMSANVSNQFATIDVTFGKIPGQLFTVDKSVTQEFVTTGERDVAQKAKGKVTIYNALGAAPQTLIATTRLESPEGLIFRTLRNVVVPGMSGTTPGAVEVEVIADKASDTYNIGPAKFTIPAFKEKGDTARYQKFSAESTVVMKDGSSGKTKIVTEEDLAKAKEIVTQKLQEEIKEALNQEASGLKIADTADVIILETIASTLVDQPAEVLTVTMKGQLKTMGFKEDDLWSLVKQYIEKNYGLTVVPDKLDLQYKATNMNESRGVLELTLKLVGNGYGQINTGRIIEDLLGKGEGDIVGYLKQAEGVAEAKVLLSPFWVKKVPKKKEKVQIQLEYQ